VDLTYEDVEGDTERIMDAIVEQLPPDAKEWHEPTREELQRTLPSSFKGNPEDFDHEENRRPGTD